MSEFLFAFFIITGFLLGTVLFGNLLYYSIHLLPKYISLKINRNLKSPVPVFIRITYPVLLWLLSAIVSVLIIYRFFNTYYWMFISGMVISLVFILIDLVKKK